MALNEIQLPQKEAFYSQTQTIADEIVRYGVRWSEAADFIATMDPADLTAMGVPAELNALLASYRQSLIDIVAAIQAEAATMNQLRRMLPV